MILGLEFPPISHVVEWPDIFGSGPFAVNKIVLFMWMSVLVVFAVLFIASRRRQPVPTGVQNLAEAAVDFVQDGIILQTMGHEGLKWTPFFLSLFTFILIGNTWGILPGIQMPVNARMAVPAFLAVVVWALYNGMGIRHHGPLGYLKSATIPPGVPKAILPLVAVIELAQILIVRPLSLAIRLFANMIAGHLLLTSFAVITAACFSLSGLIVIFPFSLFLLIALTGFELLVIFLQAYIFTILAAVFIGGAIHPEH